ncbi:MAG: ABC transporter permease, partial [Desulfobacterales bacterium]
MGVEFRILWTDALIYLLVSAIIGFVLYARRREHLVAPWRQVFRRRLGMAAFVVLLCYVSIGLLDSIHYRHPDRAEIISAFDDLAGALRTQVEKSYSAPFATHLYTKETVRLPDGTKQRIRPRLTYGGAHLQHPETDRAKDVRSRLFNGALTGLLIWALSVVSFVFLIARREKVGWRLMAGRIWRGETALPWKVILGTIGVMMVMASLVIALSTRYHILGTDKVGQDVLYQALKSIRTGLVIGTLTTLVMLPFAVMLGIMAGYFRGWVDDVIQYLYTTLSSIPGVLLIAGAILMLQVHMSNHPEAFANVTSRSDARLLFLCIILGITNWTGLCRLLRGEALKISQVDYIQAATAFGVNHMRIITRHILPNVMHIIMISVVLQFSGLVLAEVGLSYVGVGVDPSMNSWGNMINSARLEMAREPIVWWSLLAAFLFMFTLVLAA